MIDPIANHLAEEVSFWFCLIIAKIANTTALIPIKGSTTNEDISDPILKKVLLSLPYDIITHKN